jgi:hypothetical protein
MRIRCSEGSRDDRKLFNKGQPIIAILIANPQASILDSEAGLLVIPVNCITGIMGKGLALAFAERWPILKALHADDCLTGKLRPGLATVHKHKGQHFALAATKDHWRNPSRLEWIREILAHLPHWVALQNSVAIPALGCGEGGLSWDEVFPIIHSSAMTYAENSITIYPPR